MAGKFVLKKGTTGKFRFNLVASNGQVVASSEAYESRAAAMKGIESVKKHASVAELDDQTVTTPAKKGGTSSTSKPAATKKAPRTTKQAKPAATKKAPSTRNQVTPVKKSASPAVKAASPRKVAAVRRAAAKRIIT